MADAGAVDAAFAVGTGADAGEQALRAEANKSDSNRGFAILRVFMG